MKFRLQTQVGYTLIEVLLVFVIGMTMIGLGMQRFYQYRNEANIEKVKDTVDKLFTSMSLFYRLNCRNPTNGSGGFITAGSVGVLDPNHVPPPTDPYNVLINTGGASLVQSNFLAASYWPPGVILFVDPLIGEKGFFTQFNKVNVNKHAPTSTFNNWVTTTPPNNIAFTQNIGNVIAWQIHIAVKLAPSVSSSLYGYYQQRLGATCSASSSSATCLSDPAAGPYMIWERLPSYASETQSILKWTKPRVRAFNNLYYTDDMYYAYNSGSSSSNLYLCGG